MLLQHFTRPFAIGHVEKRQDQSLHLTDLVLYRDQIPVPVGRSKTRTLGILEWLGPERNHGAGVPGALEDPSILDIGKQLKVIVPNQLVDTIAGAPGIGGVHADEVELRIQIRQLNLRVLHHRLKDGTLLLNGPHQFLDLSARQDLLGDVVDNYEDAVGVAVRAG